MKIKEAYEAVTGVFPFEFTTTYSLHNGHGNLVMGNSGQISLS